MKDNNTLNYFQDLVKNIPQDWLRLTTHRLDIYNEKLAKIQFLNEFEKLVAKQDSSTNSLEQLPTAFDYIRLGHPLSCLLEWLIADWSNLEANNVISFSSRTMPILAILRKNHFTNKATRIVYEESLPACMETDLLKSIYAYNFELQQVKSKTEQQAFDGTTIFVTKQSAFTQEYFSNNPGQGIDFYVDLNEQFGSIVRVYGEDNASYVSEIQHVRRRESIAMTPASCLAALESLVGVARKENEEATEANDKEKVLDAIRTVTNTSSDAILGSSGLSIQYAIMMGLIHDAHDKFPNKQIKFVVPPNCYGGTNDQARRVAACIDNVEIVDLPVDGDNDMVQSVNTILDDLATVDAIPYIIAEIPTNPRVEVPDLLKLKEALCKNRKTASGNAANEPVFILDQTFCPNVDFLGDDAILADVKTIAYVSGSKFPSGGLCTAGYCVANKKSASLLPKIQQHIALCDNQATNLQVAILAKQLPSMNKRIKEAYENTREFVNFIEQSLPEAKINFVSEDLAREGFTPSVFSIDLPTKGDTDAEKEA